MSAASTTTSFCYILDEKKRINIAENVWIVMENYTYEIALFHFEDNEKVEMDIPAGMRITRGKTVEIKPTIGKNYAINFLYNYQLFNQTELICCFNNPRTINVEVFVADYVCK